MTSRPLRRRAAIGLGAILAAAAFGTACAEPLPDAFAGGLIDLQHISFCGSSCFVHPELFDFGSVTGTGSASGGSATATISASRSPFTISTSFNSDPGWTSSVNGDAGYSFAWIGPAGGSIDTDIDIVVHTAAASGATQAKASFEVVSEADNAAVYNNSWACAFNGCLHPDFTGTLHLTLDANVIYDVKMGTTLSTLSPASPPNAHFGGGQAEASIDPHIFQDPGSIDPLYSLVLSPDVGNTVGGPNGGGDGVPEPSTWALMLTGLGLMGLVARRRGAAAARA